MALPRCFGGNPENGIGQALHGIPVYLHEMPVSAPDLIVYRIIIVQNIGFPVFPDFHSPLPVLIQGISVWRLDLRQLIGTVRKCLVRCPGDTGRVCENNIHYCVRGYLPAVVDDLSFGPVYDLDLGAFQSCPAKGYCLSGIKVPLLYGDITANHGILNALVRGSQVDYLAVCADCYCLTPDAVEVIAHRGFCFPELIGSERQRIRSGGCPSRGIGSKSHDIRAHAVFRPVYQDRILRDVLYGDLGSGQRGVALGRFFYRFVVVLVYRHSAAPYLVLYRRIVSYRYGFPVAADLNRFAPSCIPVISDRCRNLRESVCAVRKTADGRDAVCICPDDVHHGTGGISRAVIDDEIRGLVRHLDLYVLERPVALRCRAAGFQILFLNADVSADHFIRNSTHIHNDAVFGYRERNSGAVEQIPGRWSCLCDLIVAVRKIVAARCSDALIVCRDGFNRSAAGIVDSADSDGLAVGVVDRKYGSSQSRIALLLAVFIHFGVELADGNTAGNGRFRNNRGIIGPHNALIRSILRDSDAVFGIVDQEAGRRLVFKNNDCSDRKHDFAVGVRVKRVTGNAAARHPNIREAVRVCLDNPGSKRAAARFRCRRAAVLASVESDGKLGVFQRHVTGGLSRLVDCRIHLFQDDRDRVIGRDIRIGNRCCLIFRDGKGFHAGIQGEARWCSGFPNPVGIDRQLHGSGFTVCIRCQNTQPVAVVVRIALRCVN